MQRTDPLKLIGRYQAVLLIMQWRTFCYVEQPLTSANFEDWINFSWVHSALGYCSSIFWFLRTSHPLPLTFREMCFKYFCVTEELWHSIFFFFALGHNLEEWLGTLRVLLDTYELERRSYLASKCSFSVFHFPYIEVVPCVPAVYTVSQNQEGKWKKAVSLLLRDAFF